MIVRRTALAIVVALAGCNQSVQPFSTTIGVLHPGNAIVVRALHGDINAYKPEIGKPANLFTVQASSGKRGTALVPPRMRSVGKTVYISSGDDVDSLLIRVPTGVALDASSSAGDVNVTDVTGPVTAHTDRGDIDVMVPDYAQANVGPGAGNITIYMGSTNWPGTLRFSAQQGDVEVWINATASFHAHLHTDHGAIFTDFGLRGSSIGQAETIDGSVGNPSHGIDIDVRDGNVRVLQLKPQM